MNAHKLTIAKEALKQPRTLLAVLCHAKARRKRGKNPSMPLYIEECYIDLAPTIDVAPGTLVRNPRKALQIAKLIEKGIFSA